MKTSPDIFTIGNVLEQKFPELLTAERVKKLVRLDIAIADFSYYAEKLQKKILPRLSALEPEDYEGLLDSLTELREAIDHTKRHLIAAGWTLWEVSDLLSGKLSTKGSPRASD
jgi:hypothetical protein